MTIRLAQPADVPALVPMLARAFAEDPFICWFVRGDTKRERGFQRFFEFALTKMTLPFGEVYTNDDCTGAACWTPPGKWKMGLAREIWLVRHFAAICGWSRLLTVQLGTAALVNAHPRVPHHYLFVLGVDPSAQGKGLGRALMRPMLETCDREGLPAYLETATERNLAFYQSFGFAITGEHVIKRGPKVWTMLREHPRLLSAPS